MPARRRCASSWPKFPPGRFTGTVVHEHNGLEQVMIPYEVAVEFDRRRDHIDLTDAPDAQPGPVNAPVIGVVSAIRCAMMALAHPGRTAGPTRATSGRCS